MKHCPGCNHYYANSLKLCLKCGSVLLDVDNKDLPLRFDGVYCCDCGEYTNYLRFYDDGMVVATSSTGKTQQVAKWLRYGAENVAMGAYRLEGNVAFFTTFSKQGKVGYSGFFKDRNLFVAKVHSFMNGAKSKKVFKFELAILIT